MEGGEKGEGWEGVGRERIEEERDEGKREEEDGREKGKRGVDSYSLTFNLYHFVGMKLPYNEDRVDMCISLRGQLNTVKPLYTPLGPSWWLSCIERCP